MNGGLSIYNQKGKVLMYHVLFFVIFDFRWILPALQLQLKQRRGNTRF